MNADDPRHGSTRGYHAGCRDLCCRRAIARYEKAGRLARLRGGLAVPALGSQRRLQALMALGWSSESIAAAAGLKHRNHVWRIVNGQKGKPTKWIQRETAEWVARIYDELSMTLPEGRYVSRTKAHAKSRGWLPPLFWDDIDNDPEPTIEPVPNKPGHPLVLPNILEDFDWLVSAGESPEKAAARVGVALATIRDYRVRAVRRGLEVAS